MSYMNNVVHKGNTLYHPVNKQKYMGDINKIICRSSWETAVCRWCDHNRAVLQWASEPLHIFYIDPTKRDKRGMPKKRQYFPDFLLKIQNRNKTIAIWLVEVKPYKETIPPRKSNRKAKKTQIYEANAWETNKAKWRAAEGYCARKGWKFKILNEYDLGIKKR